jgi:beta-phosphoglucomutase
MNHALAAIFDMDGVLADTYHAHYLSWVEAAKSEGLSLSESDFARTFGRTNRESLSLLWGDRHFSEATIEALGRCKEEAFRREAAINFPAMPGSAELVKSLHDAGFRLAVGSSGPPKNVDLMLNRLGIRNLLQTVVNGADVSRGKPDPEVFLLVAERLGVEPAFCAVVEDSPAGIAAANAAGMTAIGFMSTGHTPADMAGAHTVIRSLAEISPSMLRELILKE